MTHPATVRGGIKQLVLVGARTKLAAGERSQAELGACFPVLTYQVSAVCEV